MQPHRHCFVSHWRICAEIPFTLFLSGGDVLKNINEHFNRDGLFSEASAADMVRDMLLGLKEVHDNGVLHRYGCHGYLTLAGRCGDYALMFNVAFLCRGELRNGPALWRWDKV